MRTWYGGNVIVRKGKVKHFLISCSDRVVPVWTVLMILKLKGKWGGVPQNGALFLYLHTRHLMSPSINYIRVCSDSQVSGGFFHKNDIV